MFNVHIIYYYSYNSLQESSRTTDLEFVYDDTDTHASEVAELYSYTEQYELQLNLKVLLFFLIKHLSQ